MNANLVNIGLSDGGRGGSRLAESNGLHADRMTILRLVRTAPCPVMPTPTVLGVDDFAFRKGHNYGTMLYDVERHQVIELLPDRSAESLASWLRAHPGVEIISRDRGGIYAQGAREGAPDAQQVADRWHLVSNLGEALERFINQKHASLMLVANGDIDPPADLKQIAAAPDKPLPLNREQEQIEHHRTARLARYDEVLKLHLEEHSNKAIAAHMGMGQSTVRKFLRSNGFPERAPRRAVVGILGPFHKYIIEWWDRGDRDIKKLQGELKQRGCSAGRASIYDYIQKLRNENKPTRKLKPGAGKFSARTVVSSILVPVRDAKQQLLVDRLTAGSPIFKVVFDLAERFTALIRKTPREDAHLAIDLWAKDAVSSDIPSMVSFAAGLRNDWKAVVAGLSMQWSNGPVEGAINKLKTIKRDLYGRANFDLFRRCVLLAS